MTDLVALKSELDDDPLGRGYAGMTDQQASDSLNTMDRPGPVDVQELQVIVLLNRYRSNNGNDTVATNIYGRLNAMADAVVGVDVFGQGSIGGAENSTAEDVHSAITFRRMMQGDLIPLDMQEDDIGLILNSLVRGEVFGPADRTALKSLSDDQLSRQQELNLGGVNDGDVANARSLP